MTCKAKWMSGNPTTSKGLTRHPCAGGKREDLGGLYVRSGWEANWARYLEWLKVNGKIKDWAYEPFTFEFPGIKRGSKFYTPDFRIIENDGRTVWHEVKGWMDQKSRTKLRRMAKHFPNEDLRVIQRREYDAVRNVLSKIIPGWE